MIPDLWYKNAIIYSLSLDAFLDTDGDGIGDFRGAMRRLDYLQGLGVTAVWLAPFQPSPHRDHGYDIADYYGVDPRYGSPGDFAEFVNACHQRGMRVIMDLVVNHCSDQHPWFQSALSNPKCRYRDYFIWADKKPNNADKGVVFPGVQKSTWTYSRTAKAWYFHRFFKFQPDLNIANPDVQAEIMKIVGFWLQLGVSGFRMDAVPFLIASDGINVEDPEPAYALLRDIRAMAQWRKGDAVLLAEANIPADEAMEYFGEDGDRIHMIFNFPVNQALFHALATADTTLLKQAIAQSGELPETAQWANFLRNHDELDLGRLTEEQRSSVFAAFGPEPEMQLYDRGIRRRLAPMLGGDRARLELAYSLMLTLPGTPVLRYGDEIGMGDDLNLPERDAARTPMQWSGATNGGFTTSDSSVRPPIDTGPYGFSEINVSSQRSDHASLLNWTERSIRLRKELPELGRGLCIVLDSPTSVLALRYDWQGEASIYVHNFAGQATELELDSLEDDTERRALICLQTAHRSKADENGRHHIMIEPHGYRWFRFGGLDELTQSHGAQH
ncbi:MAG: alpha-amylase family protein [Sphingobium sp.]|uniref:alpha-amylase family protein n=1 Tax=Sphingobium sp. TaxID=1912891 RepID=UPI0029A515C3|nr:alpha-amylase family protein [Sphingobium sp.]MDX3910157.1 alpha-amylase family protein [Sphingobium sp.]